MARLAVGAENNILFSDWIFTEESHNSQNDRILAPSSKTSEMMTSLLIGSKTAAFNGLGRSVCQLSDQSDSCSPGVKINFEIYKELILEPEFIGAGKKLFNNEEWIFQQDSAPAHASNATQSWSRAENIEFISKEEWPP